MSGLFAAVLCCGVSFGCGTSTSDRDTAPQSEQIDAANSTQTETRLQVFASNYPLQFMTEFIGGESVSVSLPVPADIDPAFWTPEPDAIAQMQTADLIVLNGATYEKWLSAVSLPSSIQVFTSGGFRDRFITIEDLVTHSHGAEGEHSHAGTAFTTWIDFQLAVEQARAIRNALAERLPEQQEQLDANFAELERELLALDEQLEEAIAASDRQNQPLLASHPVYEYLAQRYDLNLQSVLWEPDVVPDESEWQDLQAKLSDRPAQWMLWEGTPNPESTARLEDLGVSSVVFSPAGNVSDGGDFLAVMQTNVDALMAIF